VDSAFWEAFLFGIIALFLWGIKKEDISAESITIRGIAWATIGKATVEFFWVLFLGIHKLLTRYRRRRVTIESTLSKAKEEQEPLVLEEEAFQTPSKQSKKLKKGNKK
jgi:hypothetical protein